MHDLCTNVILGLDFQSQHESVILMLVELKNHSLHLVLQNVEILLLIKAYVHLKTPLKTVDQ